MVVPDPCSLSNPSVALVTHSHYELDVDFDKKRIEGFVKLTVRAEVAGASEVVLDSNALVVRAVTLGAGAVVQHSFAPAHKVYGSALHVPLPEGLQAGQEVAVNVRFATPPGAGALQFLEPSQTAGGKHPYLFTQCQAIHARSIVPCQDSPGLKAPYTAHVRVPAALTALMSAVPVEDANAGVPHLADVAPSAATRVFAFEQRVPVPAYLLALAVGHLESRELSTRSRVWSEPETVEAAAYEFGETAQYLEIAESLVGPYVWGRYDLLLLPPSFPYGGMENPCLTFVTPTLLAGDRSLSDVIAHEIAHSWTGNLVTNATWEHFWLNEGWTKFLERKIVGRLRGEGALQLSAEGGVRSLAEAIAHYGPDHNFTKLVPDLQGADPDDSFSTVPYEKGFAFLYYLQSLVGVKLFEEFMRAYTDDFKYKAVTSEEFRTYFTNHFRENSSTADVNWDTWLYAPGPPPVANQYDTSLAEAAKKLAVKWHTCDVMGIGASPPPGSGPDDIEGWSSAQLEAFLRELTALRALTPLHASTAAALGERYGLYRQRNSELRCAWYRLALKSGDQQVLPLIVEFLKEQGRMKFVRPLYRDLFNNVGTRQLALDTFAETKHQYHPIARKMVAVDLQVQDSSA